jgi:hypothetical protein
LDNWGDEELPSYLESPPRISPPANTIGTHAPSRPRLDIEHPSEFSNPLPLQPLLLRRTRSLAVTFLRAFELPFEETAAAMESWWLDAGRCGRLAVGPSSLLGPPVLEAASGRCQMAVQLRRGVPWPSLTMDLELVPWFQTFGTRLALRPRRALHPSRYYFASGHALLDGLIAALREYAGAPVAPRH